MHEMDGLAELSLETPRSIGIRSIARDPARAERRRRELLAEVVETQVLPRLLDAYQAKSISANVPLEPRPADPDGLVTLLREGRVADACAQIETRLRSGADPQSVMIEDLSPAAQKFGGLWDSDECDIVDVSMGLGALHGLLREIAPAEPARPVGAPSILLLTTPGETHAFGIKMVESFFRSAGWRAVMSDGSHFAAALAREWFAAIGFSLSCERFGDSLQRAVAQARAASRNPRIKILVGGAIFAQKPGLAKKLGADLCAANASAAIHLSRALLREFA